MKIYITFGQVHRHTINGKILDKNTVALIHAVDEKEGRDIAFKLFDQYFFTSYTENNFDESTMKFFPRGIVELTGEDVEVGPTEIPTTGHEKTHFLKCWPEPFQKVIDRVKTFEWRKNDRDFKVGDTVILNEWYPETETFGRTYTFIIKYILTEGFGIPEDYCVISIPYDERWYT